MDIGRSDDDALTILFLTQYFPPETGAPANRVSELTRRWAAAGHDVTVVTSAPDYPKGEIHDGYRNDWHRHEEIDGVSVHSTKTVPASNASMAKRALKFVWFMIASLIVSLRVSPTPDVIVATSPQPLTGVTGYIVSRLRGCEFVFEVRDLWPESITAVSDVDNPVVVELIDAVVTFIYRHADRIVVVSQAFRDTITDGPVDNDDIWYHPNGVDPSFIEALDAAKPVSRDITDTVEDRFVVSYVGTVGRAHGLSVVLDAARELADAPGYDDVVFLIVGHGAELDSLRQRARDEGLHNVRFTGHKPKSMVPSILAETDVSLVHLRPRPLFKTVIPSKIFESMAAGVPIVLGVRGEAERIVTESDTGVAISPGDSAALADAVRDLYDDPERRRSLGENGASYVRSTFAWETIAETYLRNLQELVVNRRGEHNA